MFSPAEEQRYSRHFLLPEFGSEGQAKLKKARVVVAGAGGLGSPALLYLAAAGVGTLGVVDFDVVELSNLQRQVLHDSASLGAGKVDSALARLHALNPEVELRSHREKLGANNAMRIFAEYDVVLDGTDNASTRYLINDACVLLGKPDVSASVFRFEGQLSIFAASGGPCYRCLYPQPAAVPTCGEVGVLGVVPGVLGALQASECIKLLCGIGEPLVGKLFSIDLATLQTRLLRFARDAKCSVCGEHPSITGLRELKTSDEITAEALASSLDNVVLVDVRTSEERALNAIEPSINIPLADLKDRLGELPTDQDIVFYCKSGARSAKATSLAKEHGLTRCRSLSGGIVGWCEKNPGFLGS